MIKEVNTKVLSNRDCDKEAISESLKFLDETTEVLGIMYENKAKNVDLSDDEIKQLIYERNEARKQKNWKRADEIRDELKSKNVIIEDTPKGTVYTFK